MTRLISQSKLAVTAEEHTYLSAKKKESEATVGTDLPKLDG